MKPATTTAPCTTAFTFLFWDGNSARAVLHGGDQRPLVEDRGGQEAASTISSETRAGSSSFLERDENFENPGVADRGEQFARGGVDLGHAVRVDVDGQLVANEDELAERIEPIDRAQQPPQPVVRQLRELDERKSHIHARQRPRGAELGRQRR